MTQSWGAGVFDRLYEASEDPWQFQTSAYEQAKYAHTVKALGGERFARGLEIGCSIGVLTRLLAERCDHLLAIDASKPGLALAQRRCADLAHVIFARALVPADWPQGCFDLLVFSEILYFLSEADVRKTAVRAAAALAANGMVVLVNWTGATDTPCTGHRAAEVFADASGLQTRSSEAATSYRLDVLSAG